MSLQLFELIMSESKNENMVEDIDNNLVKDLIKGRKKNRGFIYDVVANQKNHLDVDKLDYIMRDAYSSGLNVIITTQQCDRLYNKARVIDGEICYK